MALKTKMKSTSTATVFGFLGMHPSYLAKFNKYGMKLECVGDEILITSLLTADNAIIKSSSTNLMAMMSGKLGAISKQYISSALTNLLDGLPDNAGEWDGHFADPGKEPLVYKDTSAKVSPDPLLPADAAPALGVGVNVFSLADQQSAACIPLTDAVALYQPVKGTSASARYYVVALSNDVKLAARWRQGSLSLRLEQVGPTVMTDVLTVRGFEKHSGKSHMSMHLNVGFDALLAARTLGAVIGSLMGLTNITTPHPHINRVKEK